MNQDNYSHLGDRLCLAEEMGVFDDDKSPRLGESVVEERKISRVEKRYGVLPFSFHLSRFCDETVYRERSE